MSGGSDVGGSFSKCIEKLSVFTSFSTEADDLIMSRYEYRFGDILKNCIHNGKILKLHRDDDLLVVAF